jgi:hypothetical protein
MAQALDAPVNAAGNVMLHMPPDEQSVALINLDFGPAGIHDADHDARNIQFRGTPDIGGYAVVPGDHPMLERLFVRYPMVRYVTKGDKQVAYYCSSCDDGTEFNSKPALRAHIRAVHKAAAGAEE